MQFNDLTQKKVILGFIYALKNPNNEEIFYIGATESSPKDRLAAHYSHFKEYLEGKRNKNKRFEYFENLYPILAEIEILEIVQNDCLYKKEIEYIKEYNNKFNLTNQTEGGSGGDTFTLQEKVNKMKISELISLKGSGRVMSEEQKKFLSESRMGGNNPAAKSSCMPKTIIYKEKTPLLIVKYPFEITDFLDNQFGKENHTKHSGRAGNISKTLKKNDFCNSSGFKFIKYDSINSEHIQDIVQQLEKSN